MISWIFFSRPRSASTRSRMSGMVHVSGQRRMVLPTYIAVRVLSSFAGYLGVRTGFPGKSSPQGERGPLAVHHRARMAVDEDVHGLPLGRVLDEPDGGMEELAVVRRRVDLDRLERVDALLRLLLRELVGEGRGLLLRLSLGDVAAHDLDASRLALVEPHLVLHVELEAVVRLELRVAPDRDDRDVELELDPVPHADDLGLRGPGLDPAALLLLGPLGRGGEVQGEDGHAGGLLTARRPVDRHPRSRALRPLEVRDDGRGDDPVRDVLQGRVPEVRALRDLPPA